MTEKEREQWVAETTKKVVDQSLVIGRRISNNPSAVFRPCMPSEFIAEALLCEIADLRSEIEELKRKAIHD